MGPLNFKAGENWWSKNWTYPYFAVRSIEHTFFLSLITTQDSHYIPVFLLSWSITATKHLCFYEFLVRKGCSRGVARIFQKGGRGREGVTDRDTIRGSPTICPTIYGLYRCSPSWISGLSRIIAAWRPILKMAFTAKILSWRFCHLNIVGYLLKRRPTKGGSRAPKDTPPATPLSSSFCDRERLNFQASAWRGILAGN